MSGYLTNKNSLRSIRYINSIDRIPNIPPEERKKLKEVSNRYAFRTTDYYCDLIDWSDPEDPIRKLIIPHIDELNQWGKLDASNECSITVAQGTQHKYEDTALLLCNEICGAYCRYCFRKRIFMKDNNEVSLNVSRGIEYIRSHREITDVLLTGGDPLLMSPKKLLSILEQVKSIEHVRVIRIGSKMTAFNPWLILDQPELVEGLSRLSTGCKRIYLMNHFDHPRELTNPAMDALDTLIRAGVICVNQCPMLRGINDCPDTMSELFNKLSGLGVSPYYVFQGRPAEGNMPFRVPITRGFNIVEEARSRVSGLAGRARLAMSHELGKIEVVGMDETNIYMRFHRAKYKKDRKRFMVFQRNDNAYWLEDLIPAGHVGPNVKRHTRRPGSNGYRPAPCCSSPRDLN